MTPKREIGRLFHRRFSKRWLKLSHKNSVMLNRHLKVVSQNSESSAWLHVYEDFPQGGQKLRLFRNQPEDQGDLFVVWCRYFWTQVIHDSHTLAAAGIEGSISCREGHIPASAERNGILLIKRYHCIRRHEEDQPALSALLTPPSQLNPPVEVIQLTNASHFLEQDRIQGRKQTWRTRL